MEKNITKSFVFVIIFGFVFSGNLSAKYNIFGLSIFDIYIVVIFFLLEFNAMLNKRLISTRLDKYFLRLYIFILVLPIFFNLTTILKDTGNIHVILLPIKIYIIYRILLDIEKGFADYIEGGKILNYLLLLTIIASFLGLIRYMNLPFLTDFVNQTWPIKPWRGVIEPREWGRLVSTMSGTNGGATFFSMVSILSVYRFYKTRKLRYLYIFLYLVFIVFLTGSLTSIILLSSFSIIIVKKYMKIKYMFVSIAVIFIIFTGITYNKDLNYLFNRVITDRIEGRLLTERSTIMPLSLQTRYNRWSGQIKIGIEKPIFGHAVKNNTNNIPGISLTHNYYIYLFVYTGLLGLLAYLVFYFNIFIRIYRFDKNNYMILIICFVLLAQLTQLSNHYGGISELLGVLLFLNKDKI